MTQQFWFGFLSGLFVGANLGLFVFAIVFRKKGSITRCTDEQYISQYKKED